MISTHLSIDVAPVVALITKKSSSKNRRHSRVISISTVDFVFQFDFDFVFDCDFIFEFDIVSVLGFVSQ